MGYYVFWVSGYTQRRHGRLVTVAPYIRRRPRRYRRTDLRWVI